MGKHDFCLPGETVLRGDELFFVNSAYKILLIHNGINSKRQKTQQAKKYFRKLLGKRTKENEMHIFYFGIKFIQSWKAVKT